MKKYISDIRGSVATITILTITAVVAAVALAMANINTAISNSQMNVISSKVSYYGAEGCLEEALIRIRRDPFFTGVILETGTNQTCEINVFGGDTIEINMEYLYYERNFVGEYELTELDNINRIRLLNWKEI